MAAFVVALGGFATSAGAVAVMLGRLWVSLRDTDSEVKALKARADDAESKLEKAKAEVKAETEARFAPIVAQNAAQQKEIDRLRDRSHVLASETNAIKMDLAAKSLSDSELPVRVIVENDESHPIPVHPDRPDDLASRVQPPKPKGEVA